MQDLLDFIYFLQELGEMVDKLKTKVPMSAAVSLDLRDAIDAEAVRLDRSRSYVIEKIILGEMTLPKAVDSSADGVKVDPNQCQSAQSVDSKGSRTTKFKVRAES